MNFSTYTKGFFRDWFSCSIFSRYSRTSNGIFSLSSFENFSPKDVAPNSELEFSISFWHSDSTLASNPEEVFFLLVVSSSSLLVSPFFIFCWWLDFFLLLLLLVVLTIGCSILFWQLDSELLFTPNPEEGLSLVLVLSFWVSFCFLFGWFLDFFLLFLLPLPVESSLAPA